MPQARSSALQHLRCGLFGVGEQRWNTIFLFLPAQYSQSVSKTGNKSVSWEGNRRGNLGEQLVYLLWSETSFPCELFYRALDLAEWWCLLERQYTNNQALCLSNGTSLPQLKKINKGITSYKQQALMLWGQKTDSRSTQALDKLLGQKPRSLQMWVMPPSTVFCTPRVQSQNTKQQTGACPTHRAVKHGGLPSHRIPLNCIS